MATFPGRPPVARGTEPSVGVFWASPTYFDVLGFRVLRGRVFDERDRAGQPKVVVINEAGGPPISGATRTRSRKRIGVGQGGFGDGAEVIGVVADVRYEEVETSVKPDVYLPLLQSMRASGYLFVRGRVATTPWCRRSAPSAGDGRRPSGDRCAGHGGEFGTRRWRTRMSAWLLGAFAALACAARRPRCLRGDDARGAAAYAEIGSLALGAARGDILRLVIGRALVIAVAGIAVGIALVSPPSMKLLTALLYQVEPGDPVVLGALALLLLGCGTGRRLPSAHVARRDSTAANVTRRVG